MQGKKVPPSGPEATDALRARRDRAWLRFLLVPVGGLCGLGLVEAGLRAFHPQTPSWLAIHAAHPRVPTFALAPDQQTVVETGEARWTVHTDAQGHRVDPRETDSPDAPVVLWLGDSFTFGYGVDCENTFVRRVARDQGSSRRHVNTAVGGHGPREYAMLLEDQLAMGLRPSAVIACVYLGNDFQDVLWEKPPVVKDGIIGHTDDVRSLLKVNLHTYRLASRAWQLLVLQTDRAAARTEARGGRAGQWVDGDPEEATRRVRASLARMKAACDRVGSSFHVVIVPEKSEVAAVRTAGPDGSTTSRGAGPASLRLEALLRDLDVAFTNVTGALATHPVEQTYFRFDSHFCAFGHAVVARNLLATVPALSKGD